MTISDENAPGVNQSVAGRREPPSSPSTDGPLSTGRFVVDAVLILTVAALVRFLLIDRYEIWLDEAYVFAVARQGLGDIVSALRLDNGPPLYYILLHYWTLVFGDSPAALRSLSALFSVASVAAVISWSTPWFSRRARLLAGLVFAITPLSVYYAQEARMYSPVVFFVILSMMFLERGLRTGGRRNWALHAVFMALAFYTSYIAVFLAPLGYIVAGIAYFDGEDKDALLRRIKGLLAAHVAVAVLFAPWLPIMSGQPSAEATRWMLPYWAEVNKPLLPLESLTVMTTGGAWYSPFLRTLASGPERISALKESVARGDLAGPAPRLLSSIPAVVPLALAVVLMLLLFYTALRRGGGGFPWRAFLVAWLLLTLLVPFFASFLRPMYFLGRYELPGLPAFAILSGIGLASMKRPLRSVAMAFAVLLFLYTWSLMHAFPSAGGYEAKARTIAGIAREGDVAVALGFEYAPLYYYAGEARDRVRWTTFPRETRAHAAWIDYDKWLAPAPYWDTPQPALAIEAEGALLAAIDTAGPGGRIILIRPTEEHAYLDAMAEVFGGQFVALVDAGRLEYDQAASSPSLGIMVMTVRR